MWEARNSFWWIKDWKVEYSTEICIIVNVKKNFDIHYKRSARMRTDLQRNFAASRRKSGAANDIK